MKYVVVEDSTGRISQHGTCVNLNGASPDPGYTIREFTVNAFPFNYYWDSVNFIEKTNLSVSWDKTTITADDVDTATLSTLPIGTLVIVDGVQYTVNDGSSELSASTAGEYLVVADHPRHYLLRWEITAV
jgi:hypothetical protein